LGAPNGNGLTMPITSDEQDALRSRLGSKRANDIAGVIAGIAPEIASLRLHIRTLEAKLAEIEARPGIDYRGIWRENVTYTHGQFCTHQGAMWFANYANMDRPGSNDSWVLCVKSGRQR
jgi:hypothetical protein